MKPNETPEQFEERVAARQQELTGPWVTEWRGPFQVRYRRRPDRDFLRLSMTWDDAKETLRDGFLDSVVGRAMFRFLDWLARRLG